MFTEMRRKKQLLSNDETVKIFERNTSGTLALLGNDDYPYAVPMSYVYSDGKIFFHSAETGHKTESIKKNDKASFCVIDEDNVVPEEYTTYYRSAVAFGKIRIVEDNSEKRAAIRKFAEKYVSYDAGTVEVIEKAYSKFCMIELSIEYMTGKESVKLINN